MLPRRLIQKYAHLRRLTMIRIFPVSLVTIYSIATLAEKCLLTGIKVPKGPGDWQHLQWHDFITEN